MSADLPSFCVVGAGAWGTAFAVHLARAGRPVTLVPRRAELAAALAADRENRDYLPGCTLPAGLVVDADLGRAAAGAAVILLACPTQALRETTARVAAALAAAGGPPPRLAASLAKGLEVRTHLRPSEVIAAALPGIPVGALVGPTNAGEVGRGLPAAMVLASALDKPAAAAIQAALSSPSLRVYTATDLPGVEFGGCLKNIYAIAAGCSDGLGLGDNAKAALVTRAVAEMVRVGTALGAQPGTFYGLSGFGDLVATCSGAWSRNRQFGQQIAEGRTVAALIEGRRTVVEGYGTTRSFAGLCAERGIDAPILGAVHAILYEGLSPAAALAALMGRELKGEAPHAGRPQASP